MMLSPSQLLHYNIRPFYSLITFAEVSVMQRAQPEDV